MPRPAEFDRREALLQTMETFWKQGYNSTSIKDITKATGLQPGSLYGAFESKRSLFKEALEAYYEINMAGFDERLGAGTSPLERIRGVFERILEAYNQDPDNKGCMMVNTLIEAPVDDEEINARLQEMFSAAETKLHAVVKEAQALGQIDRNKDPQTIAQTLLMGMNGLRVFCKTRPHPLVLQKSMDSFLSILA